MRILNNDQNSAIKSAILYFTKNEAQELKIALDELIESKNKKGVHYHIYDECYTHEITICTYEESNLEGFNERSLKIIKDDK